MYSLAHGKTEDDKTLPLLVEDDGAGRGKLVTAETTGVVTGPEEAELATEATLDAINDKLPALLNGAVPVSGDVLSSIDNRLAGIGPFTTVEAVDLSTADWEPQAVNPCHYLWIAGAGNLVVNGVTLLSIPAQTLLPIGAYIISQATTATGIVAIGK